MTVFQRCPFCNGQKVPMYYVGDVIGEVCLCGSRGSRWQGPYTIQPTAPPTPIKLITEEDVRRIVREELMKLLKELK